MGKVALTGLGFYAYHGVFKEENVIGNRYTVDISVQTDFKKAMLEDELEGTVDYGIIYEAVAKHMNGKPVQLLEHLGHLVIKDLLLLYPSLSQISITIKKHHPPFGGIVDFSEVTVQYPEDYDQ